MNLDLIKTDFGFTDEEVNSLITNYNNKIENFETKNQKGQHLSSLLDDLSRFKTDYVDLSGDVIKIGKPEEISDDDRKYLREKLIEFWPWRKGPFEIFGIHIDCEWQSNLKWNRLEKHLSPLHRRHVLDIGSSCGYYMFKMMKDSPELVMGIEPYINFFYQFKLLNGLAKINNMLTLPFRFEEMNDLKKKFNTVFCMGILYHRKSPIEFLQKIKSSMAKDGELILETLIIEGDEHSCLYPLDRYAKMLNVYFLPTMPVLNVWLKKAGFRKVKCVDISKTTVEEQRTNEWVKTESLADFLDPKDHGKTIEGYPAPVRAMIVANV